MSRLNKPLTLLIGCRSFVHTIDNSRWNFICFKKYSKFIARTFKLYSILTVVHYCVHYIFSFIMMFIYQLTCIVLNALGDTAEDFLVGGLIVLASAQLDVLSFELSHIGQRNNISKCLHQILLTKYQY